MTRLISFFPTAFSSGTKLRSNEILSYGTLGASKINGEARETRIARSPPFFSRYIAYFTNSFFFFFKYAPFFFAKYIKLVTRVLRLLYINRFYLFLASMLIRLKIKCVNVTGRSKSSFWFEHIASSGIFTRANYFRFYCRQFPRQIWKFYTADYK